jgi:hypothetical protein
MIEPLMTYTVSGVEARSPVSSTKQSIAAAIDEARLMKERGVKEITITAPGGRIYRERQFDLLIKRG